MNFSPKFQEEYSAKLPALTLLTNLGWSFLPAESVLSVRKQQNNVEVHCNG